MMFQWLKRYLPRGLYGRAALILILPVITLQLAVSISFVQRYFEDVTEQMTRSVLLDLTYVTDRVNAAPDAPAARAAIADTADALALKVTLPDRPVPQADSRRWYDFSGLVLRRVLRDGLVGLGPILLPDDDRVRLWIETAHGPMSVGFDRQRVSASNPHQLLVLTVLLGLLMTVIAYIYLRNQLRPIERLANASAEYGRGRVVPYSPTGATEVRAAGHAFLDMRARLERQTQARTLMLSGISHDLRTPLTRLKLGLDMLDPEEVAPLARDVADMERLLEAFLDYARGAAEDERAPVDPVALARKVIADAARMGQAVEQGAMVGEGASVQLRPMALRRALENLIGNALRFGDRARLGVQVSPRAVRFSLEDDGPGIPPGARDDAVRPFTRLDPSRNQDEGPGVGLGLAIVADIARSHGGTLRLADSEDLGGLRVDIVLPR
ncbi:ATP-binding protein [Salibaculum halophilum]|uniref:ATP-binding protein n=1 Tax=Salibaculum halophilum TaxID=1914408 RepID=UPI000A0F6CC8|nr:ATP-binding protein [Salibaculum halophilum]